MNRRTFGRAVGAALATVATSRGFGAALQAAVQSQAPESAAAHMQTMDDMMKALAPTAADRELLMPAKTRQIAMLAYPGMFALDLIGPYSVLSGLMNTQVHLVWKDTNPVDATGVKIVPSGTLAQCPSELDVLMVPGGGLGTMAMMSDPAIIEFLRDRGSRARYVTSVCTGSLVLGAAGLLRGYKATTHWVAIDVLSSLGATPVKARVVEDGNRITAAGVSAGIDYGLALAAKLSGETYAKALQLNIEYDPQPPFQAGSPEGAGETLTGLMRTMYEPVVAAGRKAAQG